MPPPDTIEALYGAIVAQARSPAFYADYGVPDTVEGRLEMIVLHLLSCFLAEPKRRATAVRKAGAGGDRPLLQRHGRQSAGNGCRRSGGAQDRCSGSPKPFMAAARPMSAALTAEMTARLAKRRHRAEYLRSGLSEVGTRTALADYMKAAGVLELLRTARLNKAGCSYPVFLSCPNSGWSGMTSNVT